MHGADLRVELLDRMLVPSDALEHEPRLLSEQILERELDDVAARREVIEQRRSLDPERLGQPRDRHVEALALEHLHGAAREVSALVDFGSAHR